MKLKGWGVPPFSLPDEPYPNTSSRKEKDKLKEPRPPKKLLEVFGNLDLVSKFSAIDVSEWLVVKNSGRDVLRNVKVEIKPPFRIYGNIPKILRPGESAAVKLIFAPGEPAFYISHLVLSDGKYEKKVQVTGLWEYLGLIYDGSIRHNGKFYYGGFTPKDFLFDGSEKFDGVHFFNGYKK